MARPIRYFGTFVWTWPYDLLSWVVILAMWVLWGTKLHWNCGLWFELKPESWPARTWYKGWGGTTLGHGGMYGPGKAGGKGVDTVTEYHELQHVEQFESIMLLAFVLMGIVLVFSTSLFQCILGLCLWVFSWPIAVLCFMLQAWLRGEDAYRGSSLEKAAYSLAADWERKKHGLD